MKPAMRTTVSKLKKGTTMKKIDWDNLEYYDFIGFVGIAAFLIYALYVGTLWYVTYDYRIFTFIIDRWDGEKKCSFFLIKEDWIRDKGF